jgi:hypothetical protein
MNHVGKQEAAKKLAEEGLRVGSASLSRWTQQPAAILFTKRKTSKSFWAKSQAATHRREW